MFAKEGYPFIIVSVITFFIVLIIPKAILLILLALVALMFFWFFRDPERVSDAKASEVVSSADGVVVEISDQLIDGVEFTKVSVFMNVFNVHVNRIPYNGKVEFTRHIDGGFIPADKPEASIRNERCETHITTDYGKLIVVQVAGLVARRIVNHLKDSDSVIRGERFGMIKFSSRVDHYLPKSAHVNVKIGDSVLAGVSSIADFSPNKNPNQD